MSFSVAVVGAGPAGLSAASELLKKNIVVDLFEKCSRPLGLIRSGVAPDREELKSNWSNLYKDLQKDRNFRANFDVEMQKDFSLKELSYGYDGIIIATGVEKDDEIPGIESQMTGRDFSKWSNGSTNKTDKVESMLTKLPSTGIISIVGGGNVAADVGRIFEKARHGIDLGGMDSRKIEILRKALVNRKIEILVRRNVEYAKFSTVELRDLFEASKGKMVASGLDSGLRTLTDRRRDLFQKMSQNSTKIPHLSLRFNSTLDIPKTNTVLTIACLGRKKNERNNFVNFTDPPVEFAGWAATGTGDLATASKSARDACDKIWQNLTKRKNEKNKNVSRCVFCKCR